MNEIRPPPPQVNQHHPPPDDDDDIIILSSSSEESVLESWIPYHRSTDAAADDCTIENKPVEKIPEASIKETTKDSPKMFIAERDRIFADQLKDRLLSTKVNKMSSLSRPILNEIFREAIFNSQGYHQEESLSNFMLSGKYTFDVGLENFRRVKSVTINEFRFVFYFGNNDGEINCCEFSLTNPFLKFVLQRAFMAINDNLAICEWPSSENIKKLNLENFLKGRFNSLVLYHPNYFNDRCKALLTRNDNIQTAKYCGHRTFAIIPALPRSCRKLVFTELGFDAFLGKKPNHLSFGNVEELVIYQDNYEFMDFYERKDVTFDFNTANMLRFSSFINDHFPKLRLLQIRFNLGRLCWSDAYANILCLKSSVFSNISSTITGNIQFEVAFHNADPLFIDGARKDETMVVEDSIITKFFEIHNGLTFLFTACCYDE